MRTETAIADEQIWGIEMKSDSGLFTELAVDTDIQLDITGLVARVEITQHFTNHGSHWAEGVYRFPLPAGAAVDRLRIKVGERLLEGEIQEKEIARQTYQKAREAGQTATIVEQQRRNQFETRLANIGPGERHRNHHRLPAERQLQRLQLPPAITHDIYTTLGTRAVIDRRTVHRHSTGTPSRTRGSRHRSPAELQASLVSSAEFAAIESRYHDVDIRQVEDGYTIELLNPDE